ncbi:MAG: FtsQ-type POTRA domain-containing protein [Candidatus Dadabacteria bacterium]|nr:FtsQ-type POTRA domain-containing protein [Candidatus Dadabacteria bacterium]MCY4262866.1 FtsQ-type POTRA domain-containing protein [Candidatus Dadabacteria bacterium]
MSVLTKGISAIFFLSLCGIIFFMVEPSDHLKVREVVITGNNRITSSEIIKRSGIRAGTTSMLFSTSQAKQEILENPWAEEVRMKKLLHGRVKVEILEREPFCIVAWDGTQPYYMDRKGNLLGEAEPSHGLDFPVISSKNEIPSGLMLQAIEILNLSKFSPALGWAEISEIVVGESFGIRLLTLDHRLITFGKDNMKSKWRKVERMIVHSRKNNLMEKDIDISSGEVGIISYDS